MQSRRAYIQVRDSITAAKLTAKPEEVERLFNDTFQPAAAKYLGTLQSLLDLQRGHINETANKVHAQADDIGIVLLATGGMAIVIGIGLSVVITGVCRDKARNST